MYKELKNEHPELKECFFAFSNEQYEEGIKEHNLEGKKLFRSVAGLLGTKEGLEQVSKAYKEREQKIREQCTPQEVYENEFSNYECGYTYDDSEALEIVENYFGKESLSTLNRFPSHLLED